MSSLSGDFTLQILVRVAESKWDAVRKTLQDLGREKVTDEDLGGEEGGEGGGLGLFCFGVGSVVVYLCVPVWLRLCFSARGVTGAAVGGCPCGMLTRLGNCVVGFLEVVCDHQMVGFSR